MKIIVLIIGFNLFSCVFSKPVRESGFLIHPKSIVIVDSSSGCEVKQIIKSTGEDWADNNDDKIIAGILRLKAIAKENGYNAISNVQFENVEKPNGKANGLVCPASKVEEFRNLQADEIWIRKQVKISN